MRQAVLAKLTLAVTASLWLAACGQAEQNQGGGYPTGPQSVGVVTLQPQTVPLMTSLPGRVTAYKVAEVRPQVGGILKQQLFTEGSMVTAGTPLYQIDPALLRAEVDAAQANVASAEASLQSQQARFQRFRNLLTERAVSQQEYDEAEASYLQAQAQVKQATAQLQKAQLNLAYTTISAPISGRIGRSMVTAGSLLQANQGQALTNIHQLDPIYVDIAQSSEQFMQLQQALKVGQLKLDEQQRVAVTVEVAGETLVGQLLFSEVSVSPDTSSLTLRAQFPNPEQLLLPGMFVSAELDQGVLQDILLAPQQGVSRDPRGRPQVMLVNANGRVEQRYIEVDGTYGAYWRVKSGLQVGDQLIVEGLQKIQPGAAVKADEVTLSHTTERN